ncbi:hypothetical protein RB653_006522 [Dictyostelium firmibasis]|uniref:EGF-like domain-containing protein n=1 Tax=Dictyostelium firmibasis TaxID=79012 RepID=A0AAN7U319_9MYCE
MVAKLQLFIILLFFCTLINSQSYNVKDLNNINTFYPKLTSQSFCIDQFTILVECKTGNIDPVLNLTSSSQSCSPIQWVENSTSLIFSCRSFQNLNLNSNYSSTFFVNGDSSKGNITINYECKGFSIGVENIQDVTWSTTFKYSSIVKIDGLPDSTVINGYNSILYSLISLGKGYYRIEYYEGFYLSKISNLSLWEIYFGYSGSNFTISMPYNTTNSILYGTAIKFRSTSSLQRPVNPIAANHIFYVSNLPRPISGSIGNMTYMGYIIPFYLVTQNNTLYKQKDDLTFEGITITTNYQNLSSDQIFFQTFSKYSNVDNSTNLVSMYTLDLGYIDIKVNYNFQYFGYSIGDVMGAEKTFKAFPFGFSTGNNLNYNMSISIPTRGFSSKPYLYMNMVSISGNGPVLNVIPSKLIVDQNSFIKLIDFEIQYIGQFNFLIRLTISDSYGLYYIFINGVKPIYIYANSLVSGNIKDGVFEILYDGVNSGTSYNQIAFVSQIDMYSVLNQNQPFSTLYPNKKLTLPSLQLLSVEHLKDIKDISYLINDVDITNRTVDNIMYFSFNNIDNYKSLPIGFTLIDPRTLRDMNFFYGSVGNLYYNPIYNFAVWDEVNSRFYVKFKIPANTSPGVLDWTLVFNKENRLTNTQLSDDHQLRVLSSNFDSYGPMVTNIVKNPNSTTVGWLLTIVDEINGFKDGCVAVMGSVDSSLYNFTLKSSDMIIGSGDKWKGDYLISIPYVLNDCVSQNYSITYALFTDTFGNANIFYAQRWGTVFNTLTIIDSTGNPFINFINDTSVLQVSIGDELCGKIDLALPILQNFTASKQSIDVGSLDRSITFNFHAHGANGLKNDQYPIVYITDTNSRVRECISTINSFNLTDIFYRCTMEVPIGFSHPYGFLLSVYGFINRGGYYSGFSSSQLKQLGYSWFVETTQFSVTTPIITSSSDIDNDGGNLWLYGRGFKSIDSISLSNGLESYSLSITNLTSDSVIFIRNIKASNNSINVKLSNTQQPTIQSNIFTINPTIYYFNYTTPTPTSTSTLTPTNKPQICTGNPVCGGSNKGYCKDNVGCICFSPYVGFDCSSQIIIVPQPKPNEKEPTIIIEKPNNNSSNVNNQYQVTSNISIIAIREIHSISGDQIKIHYIDKWFYTNISSTLSKYQSSIINNNVTTTIEATLEWFENKSNITFANQELIMNPSTIKYTVQLSPYKFSSQLNNLQIIMEAQIQTNKVDDICSGKEFGDTIIDNSNYIKLQVSSNSIYGRFLKRAIIDGKPITITNQLLDSKLNSISKQNNIQSHIGIEIGQYQTSATIDPDFSLLLDNKVANSDSPNSICSSSSSSSLSKGQLAGIIVGASVFFIIDLNNINTFYPKLTSQSYCIAQFSILVEYKTGNIEPILNLTSTRNLCSPIQSVGNSTSLIFSCSGSQLNLNSNYSSTFIVNENSSKGSITINYECKGFIIGVENIQDVTWSTTFGYSSIVKLYGLPDSTVIDEYNSLLYSLISLGKGYYRIEYYEGFYLSKMSNLSLWEIYFGYSGSNFTISMPYNTTKFKNNNNEFEEIVDLIKYKDSSIYGTAIKFRSTSSLQRPVNPIISMNLFYVSNLPRPISGSIGNMTYMGYIIPFVDVTQNNTLYKQKDDLTFEGIPITTNYQNLTQRYFQNFNKYSNVDNSTNLMSMYTLDLGYSDIEVNYDFGYLGYSVGDISYAERTFKAFPFGFSRGNNLNYNMSISIPTLGFSSKPYIIMYMLGIYGTFSVFLAVPSKLIVDQNSYIKLIDFETQYIGQFNFLIRLTISDLYGLNYIFININSIYVDSLVSGNIKDGVFEILYDGVKHVSTSTPISITFVNQVDSHFVFNLDMPFSTLYPNKKLTLPSLQLLSVEHLKDIKDISYLINDVDITNRTVDNIMYFSFNNIDNYKSLPIGFTLIDPRTLRDMNFFYGSVGNLYYNPIYNFAVWDEVNSRFYVKFKIPANTSPGVLDWTLVFNKENRLTNTQLSDDHQLRVLSSNFDSYGPMVTNIVKNPNSTTVGWLLTIVDEINGFKDGCVTVMGSVDSSLYNFTLKSSDMIIGSGDKWKGDYLISIPYILNDCVSQNYSITYALFTDTFGNVNIFYAQKSGNVFNSLTFIDSTGNPFINFINDTSVLQISIGDELCGKIDLALPILQNFTASKQSIDVGSLDRSITFNFHAHGANGLKNDQYPIVYITDTNSRVRECISTINSFNSTDIFYRCTMEVPIGFSHPYGFLLSVYGFINRGGYYSGFSSSQLKQLGYSWFVETTQFSVTTPIITSSSDIDNDGGNLWLYGRGFKSIDSISLSNGLESYSLSITNLTSDSVIFIRNIKASNNSINVKLSNTQQPTIQSNIFTINPTIYYFNYTTSTPTPTPTNKPQICTGNPVCGGSNKGYCKDNVGCICFSPYVGFDCSSQIIIVPQPKPNEKEPTIIIEKPNNNSSNVNNQYQVTSNISIIAIREIHSISGDQIKIHYIDKWFYTNISSTLSKYQSSIINNNVTTTIEATLEWFENKSNITFANQELIMNPSTIKYTVQLSPYKFSSQLNNLQIIMEAQIQTNKVDDICSGKEFGDTTIDNSNYIKLQVSSNSIYGRFLKRAIIDGKPITITNQLLDSKLNSISKQNNIQSHIGIEIGQYQTSATIDPDFSLLLDNKVANSDSPNSICSSSSSSSLSKGQLAGIIVGASVFFIIRFQQYTL